MTATAAIALAVTAIAAVGGLLVGIAALVQAVKTHASVNSKMDKLLELTARAAHAEGMKDQQERNAK